MFLCLRFFNSVLFSLTIFLFYINFIVVTFLLSVIEYQLDEEEAHEEQNLLNSNFISTSSRRCLRIAIAFWV